MGKTKAVSVLVTHRESRSSSTACIFLDIVPLDLFLAASAPGLPKIPAHQGTVPEFELPSGGCANRLAFGQGNQGVLHASLPPGINSHHVQLNEHSSEWGEEEHLQPELFALLPDPQTFTHEGQTS